MKTYKQEIDSLATWTTIAVFSLLILAVLIGA